MIPEVKRVLGAITCSTCENCIGHTCDMYCCDQHEAFEVCKTEKFKYYFGKKPVKKPVGINFHYVRR